MSAKEKKTPKIPKAFRKPLKKKRFEKILAMLADSGEKSAVEKAFPEGPGGRRRYQAPKDAKKAKEIAGILKKVRKARSGPRTVRIVLVAVLIGAPVIFGAFFLDRIASNQLEKALEKLTETDATVEGLDIDVLKGRLSIGKLALASTSDPMVDDWVVEGLAADFEWSSLFFRRVVVDEVSADFSLNRPRKSPAVYPRGISREEEDGAEGAGFSLDADLLPEIDVPTASVDLAKDLRAETEAEYAALTEGLDEDLAAARDTAERIEELLGRPLPGDKDIRGWTELVRDGRSLAEEAREQREVVEDYGRRLERARNAAAQASERARRAVEEDLAKVRAALALDRSMITEWLESAIGAYLGPKAESLFGRIASMEIGSADAGSSRKASGEETPVKGRMKSGRIVPFPVRLPPRFTVKSLHFSGPGAELNGTGVGVDHDLAGAPSIVSLDIDEESGLDCRLAAEATVDGRTGADPTAAGSLESSGWRWSSGRGPRALGGSLDVSSDFFVPAESPGTFVAEGRAALGDWNGVLRMGEAEIVTADSPGLDVGFRMEVIDGITSLRLSLGDGAFAAWSAHLTETLLPFGADQAEKALLDAVDADLSGLDGILAGLAEEGTDYEAVSGLIASRQEELEAALSEWAEKAAGDAGIPGGEGSLEKAAEGLRSLF